MITLVFHAAVLVFFLLYGLTQPVPLPKDAGASVEFGWDEVSGADISVPARSTPTPTEPVQPEETAAPPEEVAEEVATEETGDLAVPDPEEPTEPAPREEEVREETETPPAETPPEEAPQPTLDDRLSEALGSIGSGSGGEQGDQTGPGDQGDPRGTEGKGVLGGGSGSWELGGRSMMPGFGTKITDTNEEGIVTLNIWVDRQGRVTRVQPNLRESTTTSQYLINLAKNDVMNNFRFNSDAGAAIEQKGKVRYIFQLK